MRVCVELGAGIVELAGRRSVELELAGGATVRDAMEALAAAPDLAEELREGDDLAYHLLVALDGEAVRRDDWRERRLADGARLTVLAAVAGG